MRKSIFYTGLILVAVSLSPTIAMLDGEGDENCIYSRSQVKSNGDVIIHSGESMTFGGLNIVAGGNIHCRSEGSLIDNGVVVQVEGAKTFSPNTYTAGGAILLESSEDMYLQAPTFKSGQGVIIRSGKNVVF